MNSADSLPELPNRLADRRVYEQVGNSALVSLTKDRPQPPSSREFFIRLQKTCPTRNEAPVIVSGENSPR
jgi:hypothetical protein